MRATANPSPCSWLLALAKVEPITFGTATGCGPFDTFRCTTEPWSTEAPPFGVWSITVPLSRSELTCVIFHFSFASARRARASLEPSPMTFGTVVFGGPVDE